MKFGERLKQLRTNERLTQKELGEKLNVTAQAVSRWENAEVEPSLSMLTTIGKLFDVSIDSLLGKEVIDDVQSEPELEEKESVGEVIGSEQTAQKPVLGVCEKCNKPIYEGSDLIRHRSSPRSSPRIYCSSCNKKRLKNIQDQKFLEGKANRVKSYWLGGFAAAVALALGLWLSIPTGDALNILAAVVISFLVFTFVSCLILDNNFVWDMTGTIFEWGFVRMPGVIFSLDLDGLLWLLTVKLFFFIVGTIIAITFGILGIVLGLLISLFVYPFALRKNILYPGED